MVTVSTPMSADATLTGVGQRATLVGHNTLIKTVSVVSRHQWPVDLNQCRSSPCKNGGTCVNSPNTYVCQCPPGYLGRNCETGIQIVFSVSYTVRLLSSCERCLSCIENDACSPDPCKNGAKCVNRRTDYDCQCPAGYNGKDCDNSETYHKNISIWYTHAHTQAHTHTHICRSSIHSEYFVVDINECVANPCVNGKCIDGINRYTCPCLTGTYLLISWPVLCFLSLLLFIQAILERCVIEVSPQSCTRISLLIVVCLMDRHQRMHVKSMCLRSVQWPD